jgi:hypothetical protein
MAKLIVLESDAKAESLNDAQSKALKLEASRIDNSEPNKVQPPDTIDLIRPLSQERDSPNGRVEFVPESLESLTYRDGLWEMIFTGYQRRDRSYHPPNERIHMKAKIKLNAARLWEQWPRYSCLSDKSEEVTCP